MRKLIIAGITLASLVNIQAAAQQAKGTLHQARLAGSNVFGEMEDKYNAYVYSYEATSPDGDAEKKKLEKVKQQLSMMYPHRASRTAYKTTAAKEPVIIQSYAANVNPGTPPDNDFAVSRGNKAVSVINVNAAIMDAASGQVLTGRSLGFFSGSVGLQLSGRYDPKVQYDPLADRFICVMLHDRDADNYIVVGFSQSNDPDGAWAWYKFYGDYKSDSTWFDYPGVAITKDEVFITGNKIKFAAPWETGFSETVIYQVNKHDGYAADTVLDYKIWDGIQYGGKSIRNLFPVRPGWLPETNEQYFVSNRNFDVQNDTIFLVKVPGTIAQGGNLSITALKSPLAYGVPPNGRQPDTSATLATNDGRILGAYGINDEIQFVSTTINTANGASGVYHGKITNYKSSPVVSYAQIFSIDTLDFGYPNISFTGNPWGLNQSIINFNYTGPNTPAGMGAIVYDGGGYSNMVKLKEGDGSITGQNGGKAQRWGDYTASQVDYNQLGSVWIEGIYGRSDNEYGNWIVRLGSPALSVDQLSVQKQGQLFPNPVNTYLSYKFNLETAGEISFAIYDMSGRKVNDLIVKECAAGKNLIQFNTVSLPAGVYILKGVNTEGTGVMTERFVKQ